MYKAIKQIGDYKIGDIVPDRQAEAWLEQYAVPHVKKVSGKNEKVEDEMIPIEKQDESKPELKLEQNVEEKGDSSKMLDDYLSRNKHVVKKNIEEDNLDESTLKALLNLEKSDKKREGVIKVIEGKLKGVE